MLVVRRQKRARVAEKKNPTWHLYACGTLGPSSKSLTGEESIAGLEGGRACCIRPVHAREVSSRGSSVMCLQSSEAPSPGNTERFHRRARLGDRHPHKLKTLQYM
jgi:hypothetical protein